MHVAENELELYVLGRLTDSQTSAVARHASECAKCAALLAEARSFVEQVRELGHQEPTGEERPERRKYPRIPTSDPARLRVLQPVVMEPEEVYILDTSRTGLKLASPRPLDPGALVQIRLGGLTVLAEVRHCRKSGDSYHAGVSIQDAFPTAKE